MERALITADSHLVVPPTLADQLPARWRTLVSHVDRREDGDYLVRRKFGDNMTMGGGGDVQLLVREEDLSRLSHRPFREPAEPAFGPEARLEEMSRHGVKAAVLIPNAHPYELGLPAEAEQAWCSIVNDWLADTYKDHLDQFAPGIYLPLHDIGASVVELERAAGLGLRPALLPDAIHSNPYYRSEWEPLWEAAAGLRVPLTLHVSKTRYPTAHYIPYHDQPAHSALSWYELCGAMGQTISWFAYGGIFARYPNLNVVMTEGYAGWLAFALQFIDHHWVTHRFEHLAGGPQAALNLEEPPTYYIKRQAKATFMWDPLAVRNRDLTGLDCLLWGDDYPHIEGAFPETQTWVEEQFDGVPDEEIDQIVRGNAAAVFGLEA